MNYSYNSTYIQHKLTLKIEVKPLVTKKNTISKIFRQNGNKLRQNYSFNTTTYSFNKN